MMTEDIRCSAPHPIWPAFQCRAKLATVMAGSVHVAAVYDGAEPELGHVALRCPRCGAEYHAGPSDERSAVIADYQKASRRAI